jgi:uncharacterized protein (DUF1800 family)
MPRTVLTPLDKVDPVEAWQPWEPDAANPWSLKWAGHLYRRAAFGANLGELRQAVRQGLPATLDQLVQGHPEADARDSFLAVTGKQIAKKENVYELRGWWLYAMFHTLHPLREKMTLFWHDHFATSIAKVQRTDLMFKQNQVLRKHALSKFQPFLLDISRDPAMLVWLDSNSNVKGHPNENYARELMELFTLGVGNYTEHDVRESARAFTGWHTDGEQYEFSASFHDGGEKSVHRQKGNWNGEDILRILLEQDAASRFIVRKLYRYIISDTAKPPAALLQPLADAFRKSDYDIGALVKTMLHSRHFFSEYAYRQRIKSPVDYGVGTVRALVPNIGSIAPVALVNRLEAMGQQLFAPPNVKGWPGGPSWLNTATVLGRHNFAQMVASGKWTGNAYRGAGPFETVIEPPVAEEAVDLAVPEGVPVPAPPAGTKPGQPVKAPEEPPPPAELDPAAIIRSEKATEPARIVGVLVDLLLQGGITDAARGKLVDFIAEGKPKDRILDQRVRAAAHAILSMPEYQLA